MDSQFLSREFLIAMIMDHSILALEQENTKRGYFLLIPQNSQCIHTVVVDANRGLIFYSEERLALPISV